MRPSRPANSRRPQTLSVGSSGSTKETSSRYVPSENGTRASPRNRAFCSRPRQAPGRGRASPRGPAGSTRHWGELSFRLQWPVRTGWRRRFPPAATGTLVLPTFQGASREIDDEKPRKGDDEEPEQDHQELPDLRPQDLPLCRAVVAVRDMPLVSYIR